MATGLSSLSEETQLRYPLSSPLNSFGYWTLNKYYYYYYYYLLLNIRQTERQTSSVEKGLGAGGVDPGGG